MALPFLEIAGLGANLLGSVLQAGESRKRFNAMRTAARRLEKNQNQNFNDARFALRGAQTAYENDPRRATLRQMWEQRLANPNVIDPGQLSVMKAQALDNATQGGASAVSRIREQAQRMGISNSRAGLGMEAGIRSQALGRAQGISNDLDLKAALANRQAQDAVREGYAGYVGEDLDRQSGFAQQLASLLGSRTYGESSLLAQMT